MTQPNSSPAEFFDSFFGRHNVNSLAVSDIAASRAFYDKLGFQEFADKNIITFNPGWDSNAQTLATFTDVRELQHRLKALGVSLVSEADESTSGPASFIVADLDGNPILFDQHV